MCGIFSVLNNSYMSDDVEKAFQKGYRRGPESSILKYYDNVALGFHRLAINGFKKLINESKLSIFNQRFFTIRPSHEIRYNVKSFQSPFGNIPLIRELLVLGTCYLLKKDEKP